MRFLLLRHGSTALMTQQLCGRTPGIPLSPTGRAEARALAQRLSKPRILISSPIDRARETAEAIANVHGLTTRVMPEFTEFDFGDWTGRTFESLQPDDGWQQFNRMREDTRALGGESMAEVLHRAVAGMVSLLDERGGDEPVAIVTHGDVIRSVLVHAAQTSLHHYWRFTVNPASITEFDVFSAGNMRIVRANDTAHLERTGLA